MPTIVIYASLYHLKHKLVPVLSLFSFARRWGDLFA